MSIRSNIEAVMAAIQEEGSVEKEVQEKPVAAIKAGEGSMDWGVYMDMFAQNPTQLARLMPTDTTENFEMDLARTATRSTRTSKADQCRQHGLETGRASQYPPTPNDGVFSPYQSCPKSLI